MMRRRFHAGMACWLMIALIGGHGCSNSSDSDTKAAHAGKTSAGRNFSVMEDGGNVTLLIDGEQIVNLGSSMMISPETVQVFESGGTPNFLHIDWDGASSGSRGYRNQRNYYLVVPAGSATTVLMKGDNALSFYNGMTYENGNGSYQLTFDGNTLHIVEDELRFDQTDVCYKEEKRLTREFNMTTTSFQLTYCEEEYRTATLALDTGCAEIDAALQNAPWAWANLSTDDRNQKCPAIR